MNSSHSSSVWNSQPVLTHQGMFVRCPLPASSFRFASSIMGFWLWDVERCKKGKNYKSEPRH